MTVPTKTLPSGDELPAVGLGTWELHGETARESIDAALDAGYAHLDTAEGYGNEADVGEALAQYDREDLFLTSKVLPKNLAYESVVQACEASLDRLGTDYLDLYLVHWPNPTISLRETLDAMALLHEQGKVRNIGVSNFDAYRLSAARHVSDVPIAVNQIECHPGFYRPDLVEYCQENDVVVEAAAPLARMELFENEVVQDLADSYDKTPAQVILRWTVEKDVVVLPRSGSPEHVRDNGDLFDWELDAADHERLDDIDRHEPVYDTLTRDWADDTYGISP
ncbi:aldo/keto reductase [Salinirubellus sp. GCM10025818]|uniref:aldo/keto reductase n=1 Tax=Salinirubellus TaxID=2162630 RepID=UPI0030D4EFB4